MRSKSEFLADTVRDVCAMIGIEPAAITHSGLRSSRATDARRFVIARLRDAGFSVVAIAHMMNMSAAGVAYHVYPKKRAQDITRRNLNRKGRGVSVNVTTG